MWMGHTTFLHLMIPSSQTKTRHLLSDALTYAGIDPITIYASHAAGRS